MGNNQSLFYHDGVWIVAEREAEPGEPWALVDGPPVPRSLLANICDCIQDFRNCPMCELPECMSDELARTLRRLLSYTGIGERRPTDAQGVPCQWRFMTVSAAQNGRLYALLRRYAPERRLNVSWSYVGPSEAALVQVGLGMLVVIDYIFSVRRCPRTTQFH